MLTQDQFLVQLPGALRREAACERVIYEAHVGYVYQLARKYGFEDDDAADVAQEAMIIAFEKLKNYDPSKGNFKSWLAKITINEALRMKKKTKDTVSMESLGLFEQTLKQTDARSFGLEEVLPRLRPDLHELYTLYFEYGMTHQEVADNLNISLANSRVRVHRLVKQLKTLFQ
jgi:RNA polymerase sigma-70 factor (ECF subfamily)